MDVFDYIIPVSCACVLIAIPLALNSLKRWAETFVSELISEEKGQLKAELEEWFNSEKGAKTLYTIGAIIGQGAKEQIPMLGKKGKFRWTDMLGQIFGKAAGKFLGVNVGGGESEGEPQALNEEKLPKM